MSIAPHSAAALAAAAIAALSSPVWAQNAAALDSPLRLTLAAASLTLQPEPAPPPPKAGDGHGEHKRGLFDSDHAGDFVPVPPALGLNLLDAWLDPWPHTHHSRRGTPFVHLFSNEPAYLGRDFILDYALRKGAEGTEMEVEAEVEYAFTRRIGLVVEAPYAFLDPNEGNRENGLGDIAIAPRFLLVEHDRFLLSANVEFSFPTGDEDKGLGSGEAAINYSLSTWTDLSANFTLQTNTGIGHGLRTDSDTLTWGGAVTYTLYLGDQPELLRTGGSVRSHYPAGQLNLIAEIRGEHPLDGAENGSGTAEIIFGAAYSITPHVEVRGGLILPAWNPRGFDNGVIVGLIYHF